MRQLLVSLARPQRTDLYPTIRSNNWINHILQIFALFMLTGIFSTLLIPETKGKSLEELSGEDQDNFIKVVPRPSAQA